jgi:thiamine-monophosphate kinase
VRDAGEFGLIERIGRRLGDLCAGPGVVLGTGDDAAVVATGRPGAVLSVDLLVEDRDFRRGWSSAHDVGVRAAAGALADVAVMGARPSALLVGLVLPPDTAVSWVDGLVDGIAAVCRPLAVAVAGGDISAGAAVVLSMTAVGDLDGLDPVTRAGARPGDTVVVAGRLGGAAAGLAALEAGRVDDVALSAVITAQRRPDVPFAAARRLGGLGATAMTDVSDGLLADLGHIGRASGAAIDVSVARLPAYPGLAEAAAALHLPDPAGAAAGWLLTGGEDHAVVATVPAALAAAAEAAGAVAVGTVTVGSGVTVDGAEPAPGTRGWQHF